MMRPYGCVKAFGALVEVISRVLPDAGHHFRINVNRRKSSLGALLVLFSATGDEGSNRQGYAIGFLLVAVSYEVCQYLAAMTKATENKPPAGGPISIIVIFIVMGFLERDLLH
jgi:hypothetical protein